MGTERPAPRLADIGDSVVVAAPAKVNWILDVLDRRADGFHEVETVASTIDLSDELAISGRADSSGVSLHCNNPSLPSDERNLAYRAAGVFARRAGVTTGVSIRLTKRVPAGAGLGGGSADAAATLRGLNALWRLGWSTARLVPLAAAVGSDVPMLLLGGTVVARGRGEFVEPLPFAWGGRLVVVMPGYEVSTRAVYAEVRPDELRGRSDAAEAFARLIAAAAGGAEPMMRECRNGLEPASFRAFANLATLHAALERTFGRAWRLCGSGSSLFTAWDTDREAADCVQRVRAEFGMRAEAVRLTEAGGSPGERNPRRPS